MASTTGPRTTRERDRAKAHAFPVADGEEEPPDPLTGTDSRTHDRALPDQLNLATALASLRRAELALSSRRSSLEEDFFVEPDSGVRVVSIVETARSLRMASDELCLYLSAEAIDLGVQPAMLDWPEG